LFLENVKNLRSHDKGNTMKVIEEQINSIGYKLFSEVISSKTVVPQNRQRIFMVAFDIKTFGKDVEFSFPKFEGESVTLKDILQKNVEQKYTLSDNLWSYLESYALKQKEKGNGFGYGLVGPNDVARTMSARYYKDGAEILIAQKNKNPRRLTPREAKYLMGFDDKYAKLFGHKDGFPQVVSDAQSYKQFGNSVVPLVVEKIAREILKKL
jgi:DNA (cytosine-5)-methyltransferase 1